MVSGGISILIRSLVNIYLCLKSPTERFQGEVVDLSVNIRPSLAVATPLPERTAHAGLFVEQAGLPNGGGRVVRRLTEMFGWGRPSLAGAANDAPPPKVLLRAERSAEASLRGRVRLDRRAPRARYRAHALVLLGAALMGAERGGQLDGIMAQASAPAIGSPGRSVSASQWSRSPARRI